MPPETQTQDPQEAADLANLVAQSYCNLRAEIEQARIHSALDMLDAQETLQEMKVEDARARMIEITEKIRIVDLGNQTDIAGRGWLEFDGLVRRQSGQTFTTEERKIYDRYMEAKRAYENQQQILTDARQAILKEKIDLSCPRSINEIHDAAEANETPARPNVPLYLFVGFLGGGVLLFLPIATSAMYLDHAMLWIQNRTANGAFERT